MAEPDEPDAEESVPVLSPSELAHMSDVTPWANDLGRPFESYRYTSFENHTQDRQLIFPTGYEPYQEGLGWHDWYYDDRSRRTDAIVLCPQSEYAPLTYGYPRQPEAHLTRFRYLEDDECAHLGIPIHEDP